MHPQDCVYLLTALLSLGGEGFSDGLAKVGKQPADSVSGVGWNAVAGCEIDASPAILPSQVCTCRQISNGRPTPFPTLTVSVMTGQVSRL